jgi:hypothetical protein
VTVRRLVVIILALLLAVQIVRNAAVNALSPLRPEVAAKFWGDHPAVEISLALVQIAHAAREHRPVGSESFALIDDAAVKAPLAAETFLVRGVQAEAAGDREAARRAFAAAQRRDPRSVAAAYFLADHYLRSNKALAGLQQIVLLARLSPGGAGAVAPFIAAYAEDRAKWPQIRWLFRRDPGLEDSVLGVLAKDARNADAVLALADDQKSNSLWLRPLLQSLVASGDYLRARSIWSSVAGGGGNQLVFDPSFSTPGPPPPFNWSLTTSTVGLAERLPEKRLHVIFYGNDDGVLASQLVMLPRGKYHLQMQIVGSATHPELLYWSIRCDRRQDPFASAAMSEAATQGLSFEVPDNCPAQWLELSGRSGDIAQQSEVTITALRLTRAGSSA